MIKKIIECDWPGCVKTSSECKEGLGFIGWGHICGFNLDGEERDFHLCHEHINYLAKIIKEQRDGVDRS